MGDWSTVDSAAKLLKKCGLHCLDDSCRPFVDPDESGWCRYLYFLCGLLGIYLEIIISNRWILFGIKS